MNPKIAPIVDQIEGLTLLEVSELVTALKVSFQVAFRLVVVIRFRKGKRERESGNILVRFSYKARPATRSKISKPPAWPLENRQDDRETRSESRQAK